MDQTNSSPATPQQEPTRAEPLIGKILGGEFEILGLLGKGGMGEVYKAKSLSLDKIVAVKVINRVILADESSRRRLQIEAKTLAALDHPNIPRIHRVLTLDSGGMALVVDYIDGRSLAAELKESGPLASERFRRVFGDILEALAYTHDRGIIHRDIKPSNIFLSQRPDGTEQAMLIDFGLAKSLESFEQRLTQTGAVLGTIAYMSPEQLLGQPADARSDLYSLGCVMFEAATGKEPYSGSTPFEVAQQHLSSTVPPIDGKRFGVASGIVQRALSKSPQERYASAHEMLEALNTGQAMLNHPSPPLLRQWRKRFFKRNGSKQPSLMVAALLVLLVVASAAGYLYAGRQSGGAGSKSQPPLSTTADIDKIIVEIDRNYNNPVKVQALQLKFDDATRSLPSGIKFTGYHHLIQCAQNHHLDRLLEEELRNELKDAKPEPSNMQEINWAGLILFEHYRTHEQYAKAIAVAQFLIGTFDRVEDPVDPKHLSLDARLLLANLYDDLKQPKQALQCEQEVLQRVQRQGTRDWNRAKLAQALSTARGGDPKRGIAMVDQWHSKFGTAGGTELISMDNYNAHYIKSICYALLGDTAMSAKETQKAQYFYSKCANGGSRPTSTETLVNLLSGAETLPEATSKRQGTTNRQPPADGR